MGGVSYMVGGGVLGESKAWGRPRRVRWGDRGEGAISVSTLLLTMQECLK
jgi:hypothetical protein